MRRLAIPAILIVLLCPTQAWSQDRVVLQAPSGSGAMTISCDIVEFTGQEITIRPRAGSGLKRYPADRVLSVETTKTTAHAQAEELYGQHRLEAAESAFETAMRQEPRAWMRREILAGLVRCALCRGHRAVAGNRFLLLQQSDSSTPHFPLIPLAWTTEPSSTEGDAKTHALLWLAETSEVAKLLGASLLLDDSEKGRAAQTALTELTSSGDVRVRTLARSQLWRVQLRSSSVSHLEIEHWTRDAERMPKSLRAGPYYLIGRGHTLRREYEQAATSFLWLPLVYSDSPYLTARATLSAAETLEEMGQERESRDLYREIVSRFQQTEFAQLAESRLKLGTGQEDPGTLPDESNSP